MELEPKKEISFPQQIIGHDNLGMQKYNDLYRSILMRLDLGEDDEDLSIFRYFMVDGDSYRENNDIKSWYWAKKLALYLLNQDNRPWFIVNGDSDLLPKINLNEQEIRRIKENPIAVYMYEPLFLKNAGDNSYPWLPNSGQDFDCDELKWVQQFNEKYGGDLDITVYICDNGLGEMFHKRGKYRNIKIKTLDTFLADFCMSHRGVASLYDFKCDIRKKMICLNFRHEPVRELVVGYLRGRGYHEDSHISFFHKHKPNVFHGNLGFRLEEIHKHEEVKKGIEAMQNEIPYVLEVLKPQAVSPQENDIPDYNNNSNLRDDQRLVAFYRDAFVALVNETRFTAPAGSLSEKTFNPVLYMRPFILVGGAYTLQYFRDMGYQTFDRYWDESYDLIEDPAERLNAIFKIVDSIFRKSYRELQSMLISMQPILVYNQRQWARRNMKLLCQKVRLESKTDYFYANQ